MPSKLKKIIRERMAKTGERYATALAHVRARRNVPGPARDTTQAAEHASDLIVTRYFGQQVTFAIVPVQGRWVLMLAPRAGQPSAVARPHWRLLGQRGLQ
jgi:hypothetical protein